ncbi:hypothetical protein MMC28_010218 [Mycoblastus sanguinarius]|nr:hypothetical protein [Mycoblastus sanguinarius]
MSDQCVEHLEEPGRLDTKEKSAEMEETWPSSTDEELGSPTTDGESNEIEEEIDRRAQEMKEDKTAKDLRKLRRKGAFVRCVKDAEEGRYRDDEMAKLYLKSLKDLEKTMQHVIVMANDMRKANVEEVPTYWSWKLRQQWDFWLLWLNYFSINLEDPQDREEWALKAIKRARSKVAKAARDATTINQKGWGIEPTNESGGSGDDRLGESGGEAGWRVIPSISGNSNNDKSTSSEGTLKNDQRKPHGSQD